MFGSLANSVAAKANALETKLMLYIVAGIVVLVIVNILLEGIRRYIRGLDTAALGGIFLWLGYESSKIAVVSVLKNLLYLVGGTLCATGLVVFVITMLIRSKRSAKRSGPPMPKHAQTDAKAKAEAETKTEDAADVKPADSETAKN